MLCIIKDSPNEVSLDTFLSGESHQSFGNAYLICFARNVEETRPLSVESTEVVNLHYDFYRPRNYADEP